MKEPEGKNDLIYKQFVPEINLLLLCSHSPNDVPPRTSAERIHRRGTGRCASVPQKLISLSSIYINLNSMIKTVNGANILRSGK